MSAPGQAGGGQALITEKHGDTEFQKVVLVHPTGKASCEIYLQGATVTSWKIFGQELLYLSPKAVFAPGKAIRGGIPIVFPQFGPGALPQHGFARNSVWTHGETSVIKSSGDISTTFTLRDSEATRSQWPHAFELTLTVLLKSTSLSMQLRVTNKNEDNKPFEFTSLLHTYLKVEHISKTTVRGLQGKSYVDQVDGNKLKEEKSESVIFQQEVDRKYRDVGNAPISVNDGGNCELQIKQTGFKDYVVWNPHIEKTSRMSDLPPSGWEHFVCVEAGAVMEPITLQAGESWEGAQGISLLMLPELGSKLAENNAAAGKL